jgi:glutamate synthase (NADPH/NADH)
MVGAAFANSNNIHASDNGEEEQPLSVFPYQDTAENKSWAGTLPLKQGLYDPSLEKDACGVGFAA